MLIRLKKKLINNAIDDIPIKKFKRNFMRKFELDKWNIELYFIRSILVKMNYTIKMRNSLV